MSSFNKKRGRVISTEVLEDGMVCIEAEAPQAEVMNYAIDLRSLTQGQGYFDMKFLDYEFANDEVTKKVQAAKAK